MKLNLECIRQTIDWVEYPIVEIDVDKYVFFQLDYRGDRGIWYLIGHKCDDNHKWTTDELSVHGCYFKNICNFIKEVNKCKGRNMVSRFNNLHYSNGYYDELNRLLIAVNEQHT